MYLLTHITNRAVESWKRETTLENFDEWVEHWFKTAEAIRLECELEGLLSSVKEIEAIVADQRRIVERKSRAVS